MSNPEFVGCTEAHKSRYFCHDKSIDAGAYIISFCYHILDIQC